MVNINTFLYLCQFKKKKNNKWMEALIWIVSIFYLSKITANGYQNAVYQTKLLERELNYKINYEKYNYCLW